MKEKQLLYILAGSLLSATVYAAPEEIATLAISSGEFSMGVFTPVPNALSFGSAASANIIGGFIAPDWDSDAPQFDFQSEVTGFNFNGGGVWVNTYLAIASAQNVDGGNHPAPTGIVDFATGTLSLDMSSLYANWNGIDFNQGNANAMGTVTSFDAAAGTFTYNMTWTSIVVGGPFNGQTGTWSIAGTGTIVPVTPPCTRKIKKLCEFGGRPARN